MTELYDPERNMDPQLMKKIQALRITPERDAEAVEQGRQKFLAELDSIQEFESRSTFAWLAGWFKNRRKHQEDASLNPRTRRFTFATAAVLITILFLLFSGAGATALAAQSTLPGDTLYVVKTGLENTRVLLAGDAYDQAQLHLSFARRRLDEMSALVQKGRYGNVELASKEFEAYVEKATSALPTVMAENPERGALLSNQITHALLSYVSILKGVQASVPDAFQPAVEHAILISQTSAGEEIEFTGVVESLPGTTWVVSGRTFTIIDLTEIKGTISIGDTVKVHAILGSDGTLTAQKIELSDADGDANQIDDGDVNQVDDGDANPVDDGDTNQVDNGGANQVDDGGANQVDDGGANQGDNGGANQGDNGGANNNDNGNANNGDNGNP